MYLSKVKHELYYGSTYLSQSSRTLIINENVEKIEVINNKGERRTLNSLEKLEN